ncbi:Amyloid-beta A4 precursor protein-binding family A member 3 [Manis javanica]|nr:Amyloid-beta A4 precursor protein-binding family A member 3 [Manis javanica]
MEGEFKKADPVQALWIVDRLEKGCLLNLTSQSSRGRLSSELGLSCCLLSPESILHPDERAFCQHSVFALLWREVGLDLFLERAGHGRANPDHRDLALQPPILSLTGASRSKRSFESGVWMKRRLTDSNYIFRLGSEMPAGAWDPSMEFLTTSAPPPEPPALDLKEPRDAFAFQDLNINPQGPEAVVVNPFLLRNQEPVLSGVDYSSGVEDLLDTVICGTKCLASTQLVSECTLPPSSLMAKVQEVIDIVKKINQHVFC